MEELVPLEKESKKKFEKHVKGINKLLKSGKLKPAEDKIKEKESIENKAVANDRGVVYVGHIPHGFFEEQMKSYFKQFGKVTNVRVARSKKNGSSKGFGFVEFQDKEVAQIVAETMNNYLMDKRLIKAEYIPPEKQRSNLFKGKNWIEGKSCPGIISRKKNVFNHNKPVTKPEWILEAKRQLKKLNKTKSKLRSLGIDYDFFTPIDIPEELKAENAALVARTTKKKKSPKSKKGDDSSDKGKEIPLVSPGKIKKKKASKEKSMDIPMSVVGKPPKTKKAEKKNAGAFVRPLLSKNIDDIDDIDEISPKKEKKDKKMKKIKDLPITKAIDVQEDHKPVKKNKTDRLLQRKETGGIQKKSGKNKSKNIKMEIKMSAKDLMNSDMVKIINTKKITDFKKGKNNKKGKFNK